MTQPCFWGYLWTYSLFFGLSFSFQAFCLVLFLQSLLSLRCVNMIKYLFVAFFFLFSQSALSDPTPEGWVSKSACPSPSGNPSSTWHKRDRVNPGGLIAYIDTFECGSQQPWGFALEKNGQEGACVMSAMITPDKTCVCDSSSGAFYDSASSSCGCPAGKQMNLWTKTCETPCAPGQERTDPAGACSEPSVPCVSPKVKVGGVCSCPSGTLASGESCMPLPDCTSKQAECTSKCQSEGKPLSRFYCEASTSSDPSTQLFSGSSYACECGSSDECPQGQQKVIATTGLSSCKASSGSGCPVGSYYGDFNGKTGCIEPAPPPSDPDSPPNNCLQGSDPVYHGSTLYCVPPPGSDKTKVGHDAGCPSGTSPILKSGTYVCQGADGSGRTQPSGGGSGSHSGSGIGSSDAAIAAVGAVEQQLKDNAASDKASSDKTNQELKDINSKLFATNQALQGIKDAIPTEIKTQEEAVSNDVTTLKAAMNAAIGRLENAPIISAGVGALGSFPDSGGQCPVIAFEFWGSEISSSLHCDLFESVRSQFSAVMLAFWSIFAVFVFRRMS